VNLFKENIDTEEKYKALKTLIGSDIDIESENTIVFFDEVQESEELISSLKFFSEKHQNINIICAGSLLGVRLKRSSISFPVGKVEMINMYPMDFEEFLLAFDEDLLIEKIKESYSTDKELINVLHDTALRLYKYYLCVGGMPASVLSLVKANRDMTKYDSKILEDIIDAYFNDMSRYVINKPESLKIEKLYRSVPNQLANSTNRFQYTRIERKARKQYYETALDWLLASRLLIKADKVKIPEIPMKGFVEANYFKLYMSDVGLLRNMLGLRFNDILLDNLSLYKGVMVESYVANEFVSSNMDLFYWLSDGIAEVDFLLYSNKGVIPVEVKASDAVKSKSLRVYIENFKPEYSIRVSTRNFGFVNGIKSVPLYAVFCIKGN